VLRQVVVADPGGSLIPLPPAKASLATTPDHGRWPPNRKTKPAKKKRRRPPEEFISYVVEITGCDWAIPSLNASTGKYRDDDPYELWHLLIIGRLLRPTGLKTDVVEVSLLPGNDTSEERRKDYEPIALGSLDASRPGCSHSGVMQATSAPP
jgi:hypothetical protein